MMAQNCAIDAEREPNERSASHCPECDVVRGAVHAADCPLRPILRYDDYLTERYARGDASVFRVSGVFQAFDEPIEPHQ